MIIRILKFLEVAAGVSAGVAMWWRTGEPWLGVITTVIIAMIGTLLYWSRIES